MTATYTLADQELRGPLTPIEDTILVKVAQKKTQTSGGLFLPSQSVETPTRGTVVAVGPGSSHWESGTVNPMLVEVGEQVVYGKYDGTSIKYQGEDHLLVRDDDVLMAYRGGELEDLSLDQLRMVGDRVLVKVVKEAETKKASGVMIAATTAKGIKATVGEVVKVGEGRVAFNGETMPLEVQPGDQVKFRDFSAEYISPKTLSVAGLEFFVIKNTDVIAKW